MTIARSIIDDIVGDPELLRELREALGVPADTGAARGRRLSIDQAASRLNVAPETLRRAARTGRAPGATKVGKSWSFPPDIDHLDEPAPRGDPLADAPPPRRAPRAPVRRVGRGTLSDAIREG